MTIWEPADGYLLNHSAGLPPADTREKVGDALFHPLTPANDRVWPNWLAGVDQFRDALAQVIHTDARWICPQSNVSAALTAVLGALPCQQGKTKLLIAERAFPSLGFVLAAAQRHGFELQMIPASENTLDPNTWDRYLTSDVFCAVLTHVHSNTSECHNIAPVSERARSRGIVTFVDVAQSIGIRPIDVAQWQVDFIGGSCLKWLCGGSGAGFLWVNPARVDECEPEDAGWFSHSNPFEFDIHHFEYAPDALRFWGGTPSVAPCLMANHSIRALLDVGLKEVESHNRSLSARLCDAVEASFQVSPVDPAQRGGTVVLNFGARQDQFVATLKEAGIQFDVRREGVRLSPHWYNTDADIDRIINCIP